MRADSITLIAPYLAPAAIGPRAVRSRRLATGLRAVGHRVHAIVVGEGDSPADADVLAAARGPLVGRMGEPGMGTRLRLRSAAIRQARRALPLPDAHLGWALGLTRDRRLRVPPSPATVVYAVAAPFSSLVLGATLARRWGVPLVADLGDPWPIRGAAEARVAEWVLEAVTALVVTTERAAERYRGAVAATVPIIVAPNGADELVRAGGGDCEPPLFLQLGTLSDQRVDPNPAFRALAGLEREGGLRFRSHGEAWVRFEREVAGHHLGVVSGDEARTLMGSAAALLVIGNRSEIQVPSKVYEIARSSAWGLYVSEFEREPGAEILRRSGHGVVCANTEAAIRAGAIEILAREARGERPAPSAEFSWQRSIDRVIGLLEGAPATALSAPA